MNELTPLSLTELIDLKELESLLVAFYQFSGIPTAVINIKGDLLIGGENTGWRSICLDFHCLNTGNFKNCKICDKSITQSLNKNQKFNQYVCDNGLVNAAIPIVFEDKHYGNILSGQFLSKKADMNFFIQQAKKFNYNEVEYIKALKEVPIVNNEKLIKTMLFLESISKYIYEVAAVKKKLILNNTMLEKKVQERTNELLISNQRLHQLARTDALTTIPNRRKFNEDIISMHNYAVRYNIPITAFMIDVDFFKEYNDYYGHPKGDECLQAIARKLQTFAKREGELIARYGGEEFVMILLGLSPQEAINHAIKCQQAISELKVEHYPSELSPYVTISLGESTVEVPEEVTIKDLIRNADKALYRAKKLGRNRIEHHSIAGREKGTIE